MDTPTLKEFTKAQAKELVKAFQSLHIKQAKGEGTFEVIATTEGVDRDGEVILIKGWDLKNFMKNPVLLFGHDYWSYPIGAVTEVNAEGDKLIAKGVFARTEEGQKARQLYDDGILKAVSVGFIPRKREGNVIIEAELLELSFVPVPANADALDNRKQLKEFENMLKTKVEVQKSVVPFAPTTPADEGDEWDAGKAVESLKDWASDDEGNIDFDKYKQGFAWFKSEEPDLQGSYKLPHHEVVDGTLKVVWRGVAAAMAAILGARGGVDIPDAEIEGVYNHLAKHYKQFDKEAPELKTYTQYELDNLFPEAKSDEMPEDAKEQVALIVKNLKEDVNSLVANAIESIGMAIGEVKTSAKPNEKAGRVLSAKTRTSIKNAVDAMGKAIAELKSLLDSADETDPEPKAADFDLLRVLQTIDKTVEVGIVKVKERIYK